MFLNSFISKNNTKWKEALDVGRKKAKWDGNGKRKEWERKREEREKLRVRFQPKLLYTYLINFHIPKIKENMIT